jgi:hypothetical protein
MLIDTHIEIPYRYIQIYLQHDVTLTEVLTMTTEKLDKFFWEIYRAKPLYLAGANVMPGSILKTDWSFHIFEEFRIPSFQHMRGYAWSDYLLGADYKRDSVWLDANILEGVIQTKTDFSLGLAAPRWGLSAGLNLSQDREVSLEVSGIKAQVFEQGFAGHFLRTELRQLKSRAPDKYQWIRDDCLVVETYHVTELIMAFEQGGSISARADLERQGLELSVEGVEHNWMSDSVLKLEGNNKVPFAVRYLKI